MKIRIEINLGQSQQFQCGHVRFETCRFLVGTCVCMSLPDLASKASGLDEVSKKRV